MAITYKKLTELDSATLPLAGSAEYVHVVQSGASRKALWSGIFGSGWWSALKLALSTFVAPEATHATDSDTCGTESPSDFHDAAQLTGALALDRIPAELTGKNAATATTAAACSGNAASTTTVPNCGFLQGHVLPGNSGETYIYIASYQPGNYIVMNSAHGGVDIGSNITIFFYIRKS